MHNKESVKYYEKGQVLHLQGDLFGAEKAYNKAIKINKNFGEAYNNLGNVMMDLKKYKDAEILYKKALHFFPNHTMILSNIGNALQHHGRNKEAVVWLNKAISIDSSYADAYHNLGNALRELKRLDDSILSYNKAIKLKPDMAESYTNMGVVLNDLGRYEDAVDAHNNAIKIKPDHVESYYNLGNALKELGLLKDAVDSYDRAIQMKSDFAEAYCNKGVALKELGLLENALDNYDKAIRIKPDYVDAYSNYGVVLQELGQLDHAVEYYEKAINIKNDDAEAHWNLSLALLLMGNFRDGWREYEYGKLIKENPRRIIFNISYKLWDGEDLENKTILVTAEQGVGDEVLFSSCIPDLIKRHPKKIILECDQRLELLFTRSFPGVSVQGVREEESKDWINGIGNIDFQVAAGSLPKFFRGSLEAFPKLDAFLLPDQMQISKWKERYAKIGNGLKIGVSWIGGTKKVKKARSIELQEFGPIFQSSAHFINLQYGDCTEEIDQLERDTGIHLYDWEDSDPLKDLDDFAAQIAALDLVISIDNSTVHFAGAVGTPVWVLLPFSPDFRWMLHRNDSPWYPTARLFRQKKLGDWSNVVDEVRYSLTNVISSNAGSNIF